MSVTGQPNSEPTRVGTSIGDITAGLFTAIGINAALYDRQKTGKGMFIDVSMLDCQIAILENAIARYLSKNYGSLLNSGIFRRLHSFSKSLSFPAAIYM